PSSVAGPAGTPRCKASSPPRSSPPRRAAGSPSTPRSNERDREEDRERPAVRARRSGAAGGRSRAGARALRRGALGERSAPDLVVLAGPTGKGRAAPLPSGRAKARLAGRPKQVHVAVRTLLAGHTDLFGLALRGGVRLRRKLGRLRRPRAEIRPRRWEGEAGGHDGAGDRDEQERRTHLCLRVGGRAPVPANVKKRAEAPGRSEPALGSSDARW